MIAEFPEGVRIVDGQYMHAERAGAYLLVDGDEAAYIDNITRFSTPHLMDALGAAGMAPEQLRYIIVTHIHLDHSGGTAELAKHCPDATVLCHPRAARHIVDPSRLVAGATAVYGGEEFAKLYGEIEPVAEDRVRAVEDNETVELGGRTLTFLDAPGHARHQHAILESGSNSVFAGDAFGTTYRQLVNGERDHFNYVSAPPQFEPGPAKETIQRIVDTGCDRVFVTHYGGSENLQDGAEQLFYQLDAMEALAQRAAETDLDGEALFAYCKEATWEIFKTSLSNGGLNPDDADVRDWATKEHNISSQGIQFLAEQQR